MLSIMQFCNVMRLSIAAGGISQDILSAGQKLIKSMLQSLEQFFFLWLGSMLLTDQQRWRGQLKLKQSNKNGRLFKCILNLFASSAQIPKPVQHHQGETSHPCSQGLDLSSYRTSFYLSRQKKMEAMLFFLNWRVHIRSSSKAGDGKQHVACQGGAPAVKAKAWPTTGCHNQGLQSLVWQETKLGCIMCGQNTLTDCVSKYCLFPNTVLYGIPFLHQ